MRRHVWVAICTAEVLAGCGQTAAAGGPDAVADAAVAPDTGPDVTDTAAVDAAVDVSAGCDEGHCVKDAAVADADAGADASADADADAIDCAAIMTALQDAISALAKSDNACQQDADCTTVSTSTACQGACGMGINSKFVSGFQSALAALDAQYCLQTGYAASCGYASPKCIAPNPGCVANLCVYKK